MVFTDTAGSSAGAHDADDISIFLRQLLHRSYSTSSTSSPPFASTSTSITPPPSTFPSVGPHAGDQHQLPCFSSPHHQFSTLSTFLSGSDRFGRSSDDSLADVVLNAPQAGYAPVSRESIFSSESLTGSAPVMSLENEYGEEYDCESEEAVAEEADLRLPPSRNQSKRSRAAEVHNLSEKRRRSRINEKMKALQNLIPNSNKTDKASMLDEAIEYLKQLQLQVQMLSMRNGLSLHPLCVPGVSGILHPAELSQIGLDFTNKGRSLEVNMPNKLNMLPARSHDVLNPAKQCLPSKRSSLPSVSSVMNSEPSSYGLESSIQDNFGPFQLRNYPQAVCRDQNVHSEQLVPNNTQPKPTGIVTTTPLPFDTRDLDVKGHNLLEAPSQQTYGQQKMFP